MSKDAPFSMAEIDEMRRIARLAVNDHLRHYLKSDSVTRNLGLAMEHALNNNEIPLAMTLANTWFMHRQGLIAPFCLGTTSLVAAIHPDA